MKNKKNDTRTVRETQKHTPNTEKNKHSKFTKKVLAIPKHDAQTIRKTRTNHTHQMQKTHTASS